MAPRRARIPLIVALPLVCAFAASLVLVLATARQAHITPAVGFVAAGGLAAIASVMVRHVGTAGVAGALLGAGFVVSQLGRPPAVVPAAASGVLLCACFELTTLAISSRSIIRFDDGARRRRHRDSGLAIAAATLCASVVAVAATVGHDSGVVGFGFASVAATSAVVLISGLLAGSGID